MNLVLFDFVNELIDYDTKCSQNDFRNPNLFEKLTKRIIAIPCPQVPSEATIRWLQFPA